MYAQSFVGRISFFYSRTPYLMERPLVLWDGVGMSLTYILNRTGVII
jgi:hypothetical protein